MLPDNIVLFLSEYLYEPLHIHCISPVCQSAVCRVPFSLQFTGDDNLNPLLLCQFFFPLTIRILVQLFLYNYII